MTRRRWRGGEAARATADAAFVSSVPATGGDWRGHCNTAGGALTQNAQKYHVGQSFNIPPPTGAPCPEPLRASYCGGAPYVGGAPAGLYAFWS